MDTPQSMRNRMPLRAFVFLSLWAAFPALAETYHLPLLPRATDALRQGVVRIVNHSADAGEVLVTAIDDSGRYFGPVPLTLDAQAAIEFSSTDLERGNETLGIVPGIGNGEGDWRLLMESDLDIEPLAYAKSPTGFMDRLHDVAPRRWFYHRVTLIAPDSLHDRGGTLRLINRDHTEAEVLIVGQDENGDSGSGQVVLHLPAGSSRSIAASELEDGAYGLTGRLGDRHGDWRLLIFADSGLDIEAMTLLEHSSGTLANLSTARADDGTILLFLSTGEPSRKGELRLTSRSGSGEVRIYAMDEAGQYFGSVDLELEARRTVTLDSHDLESGNAAKGLPMGLGRGEGDWRLFLHSYLDLEVFAYARTEDGLRSAIADVAVTRDRRHHIPLFNAASGLRTSQLRLINSSAEPAGIRIQAWDDAGQSASNGAVWISLPPGTTRMLDAFDLQYGADDLDGSFGEGDGNWRLLVDADQDIHVMSLMANTEGDLTNISSTSIVPQFLIECVGGSPDADDDGIADRCDTKPETALRPLGACGDGTFVSSPGLNAGLAGDCRVLIGFANFQAQSDDLPRDHAVRRWGFGEQRRIDDWEGVVLSYDSPFSLRVRELRLRGSDDQPGGLNGPIPSGFATLEHLRVLDLAYNQLSGSIPRYLGQLPELEYLWLAHNRLTGSIPVELGQLRQLRSLWLGFNRLTGSIPPELGRLTSLTYLGLGSNGLTGTIPTELGDLVELTQLWLQANQLVGSIPLELGSLSQLQKLSLYDNRLAGSIPPELGRLNRLTGLWLYRNELTGSIPPELGNLSVLEDLSIGDNRLTGSIPPELGKLGRLTELWLYENDLTGSIPPALGNLSQLEQLSLYGNRLTGSIPPELGRLSRLTDLWLYRNELTGPIPPELGNLIELEFVSLGRNRLTGSIPPEFGRLSRLHELWLYSNELTGSIPQELSNLRELQVLQLWGNQLSGTIPPQLGNLTDLRRLGLSNNRLTGEIPVELGSLDQLEYMSVRNNRMSGTIPWALWGRSQRGGLDLHYSGNALEGVSPPPVRGSPVFSGAAAENGNASHHSVAYYQGPLTWEWNWTDAATEHQQPLLGRWAALAVRIDHETSRAPLVASRVLDSGGAVLADRLPEAASPVTQSLGAGKWRTEYVFDMPGRLYQAGNQVVHIIDPDNDLAETDEGDNVGAAIRLYGRRPPPFRVTFIPLHPPGQEPPSLDPAALMTGTLAYLPIRDDFEATIGRPRQSRADDKHELLDEIRAIWNAEADADELYHGVFVSPWPGTANRGARVGGVADRPGWIGVSEILPHDTIPHELGHNLSLRHPPGCDASFTDEGYPYTNGGLGPVPGWDLNWRRFASDEDHDITDVMSYCGNEHLISGYHYRKATNHWLGTATATRSLGALYQYRGLSAQGMQPSNPSPASTGPSAAGTGALALSGRIDSSGTWSLTHAQTTEKPPRPPPPDGQFTLILYDASGAELFREQLAPATLSHGDEGGWAARTPLTQPPAREVAILNPQGVPVLRDEILLR